LTKLNNLNLEKTAKELLDTFFEAGKIAKEISSQGVKITIKPDNTPVTDGDIAVDKLLRNKIEKLTPDIPIISEETVDLNIKNKNKTFWLIDPIDGTKDYINNKDEYTLNSALIIDSKPVIGIVHAPAKNRLFFSYNFGSAYEIHDGKEKILNCKKINTEEIIGLAYYGNTSKKILDIYKDHKVSKIIRMSSSLKFCILAAGEADIYAAEPRAFEWDIAAGHAILMHAGGSITTMDGKKIFYGKENYRNPSLVAKRKKDL